MKDQIVTWLKDYAEKNNIKTLVIGVSGGIDSAVTSTLCAETGLDTIVMNMPIKQSNSELDRGLEHMKWLEDNYDNVRSFSINLEETFKALCADMGLVDHGLAEANSRSRLRMTALYHMATYQGNALVVGTGNKVEDFGVGFYTKYGDGGVDISPIADLMKSEVYAVGKELGIIESIMIAPPTDGLWGDTRTDEDQIGASYDELEWAMEFDGDESELGPRDLEVLQIYRKFNSQNKHKMLPIPVFTKS